MPIPSEQIANLDAAAVSTALAQLTTGWTPGPGVSPEALTVARQALAQTLLSGKTVEEIQTLTAPRKTGQPTDPELSAKLLEIASGVITERGNLP